MDAKDVLETDFHSSRVKINVTNFVFLLKCLKHFEKKQCLLAESMFTEQVNYLQ
jgi:hypothetical protein